MNLGPSQTSEEAVKTLLRLRSFAPFRFSGIWHVAVINGEGVAYRALTDLRKRMAKAGLTSIEVASV